MAQPWRALLEHERERLLELRRGLEAGPLHEPPGEAAAELSSLDQHPADIASEMLELEIERSILHSIEGSLQEVSAALGRVDRGTYGACQVCGVRIPLDRLRAVPATRYCVEHEARFEGDGAGVAAGLAAREAVQNLDLLPVDDEPEERQLLGPEERALHAAGSIPWSPRPFSQELELAEMNDWERTTAERWQAASEESADRRDAEAAALDEESLGPRAL